MYLLFIHCIQLLCDDHSNGDANYDNKNCDNNNGGNRNDNGDGNGNGNGGYDYKNNGNAISTDAGIVLVVTETAAVIWMPVVIGCQEQAGLRVTNTNLVENNRCNYFSCIVIYVF